MSEPKYKIGQLVLIPRHSNPMPIAEVVTCYRFVKEIGALWREEELTPYVRPLAVGDRVRIRGETVAHEIKAIDDLYAWIKHTGFCAGKIAALNVLERIPPEAGDSERKAVKS